MNQSITQFWVAVIGLLGLVAVTLMALVCQAFDRSVGDVILGMLIGGLLSVTATASAWLFRITNGTAQKAQDNPPA